MPRHRRARLENRSGFTLIMMMFMLVVVMGCAALAIDASLMYSYRGQLSRTADATALAGVIALANGAGAASADTAVHYAAINKVGLSTTTLASGDVVPGTWTSGGGFVATAGWTTGNPYAVKTTTRYTGGYKFAQYFGFTTKNLTAVAVAVRGSVSTEGCVRPWAVSYQSLLDQIGGGFTVTHDLTTAEVNQLRLATIANEITMNAAGTDGAPHQSRAVRMGPREYATTPYAGSPNNPSANVYRDEISADCTTLDALIGSRGVSVDDWLEPTNGQMTGPTDQGVHNLLCGSNNCTPGAPVRVNVAIWDTYGASTHGQCGACFHVKYMGVFYVTGYDGAHGNNNITGYFSAVGADGGSGFVPKPGPLTKNALVF